MTGAGGALGSEYCRLLAARGAAVVVNDLGGSTTGEGSSNDYADQVVQDIRARGGRAIANYDTVATAAGGAAMVPPPSRTLAVSISSSTTPAISATSALANSRSWI